MRTVELDDDVYQFLVQNTREIGESASAILRRLLGLAGDTPRTAGTSAVAAAAAHSTANRHGHELSEAFTAPEFFTARTAVDRLVYILSVVAAQQGTAFERVLALSGRERRYFGRSRHEIEASGSSTQPRAIGDTGYWVMTNSPTPAKQQLVRDVLRMFGYSSAAIRDAGERIA